MLRNSRLQLAAALCLMLGVFPLWYWYCTWAADGMVFALTGISLLLTAAAWLHRRYGFPIEKKSILLAGLLARTAAILLGIGGYFLGHMLLTQSASIGMGILIWLVYLTSWEIQKLPTDKLLSVHAFILMCLAYFIGLVLFWLQNRAPFGDVCFLMLAVNASLFGILRNFRMLLEATAGRVLPKGFYRHNLILLLCFLIPGAAVFACRNWIAAISGMVLNAIWSALVKLWKLISAIIYRPDDIQTIIDSGNGTGTGGTNLAWIGLLINCIIIGALLFLMIRFRAELWEFLRDTLSGMYRFVRKVLLLKAVELPPEEHPEYTDSVELLDTSPAHAGRKRYLSWQKQYRRYQKLKDPSEKFRAGYALWMQALKHWHADVPPNAAPAKLLELCSGIPDPALTAHITKLYYLVRYADHPPTPQELAEMDKLIRTVRKTLLTVHYRIPD